MGSTEDRHRSASRTYRVGPSDQLKFPRENSPSSPNAPQQRGPRIDLKVRPALLLIPQRTHIPLPKSCHIRELENQSGLRLVAISRQGWVLKSLDSSLKTIEPLACRFSCAASIQCTEFVPLKIKESNRLRSTSSYYR